MHQLSRRRRAPPRAGLSERSTWVRLYWNDLVAQAQTYYQESQIERLLEELAMREGKRWERREPDYRHFGTPEYALHLSWDHRQVAWVKVSKVIEIYMGYAGTLIIAGKTVTVLLRQHWQRDYSLVQQSLEQAYHDPRLETCLTEVDR